MRQDGRPRTGRPFVFTALAAALACGLAAAPRASAAPVPGFREEFPGTSTSSWGGGTLPTNPGSGGVGGVGDGYLEVRTTTIANLATNSAGAEYLGDWSAAGVTQVRAWLRDVGGTGALSIHFLIGAQTSNFWSHDPGFVPPADRWAEYLIDLASAADFTQVRGSGTFAAALQSVDRVNFRHDLPPFGAAPDPVLGAFGLDHLLLTDGVTAVEPRGPRARPVLLAPPYPNPARGRATCVFTAPEPGSVTLRVLDAAGRLVRRTTLEPGSHGPRLWLWDGCAESGSPAPAGVYRVVATGAGGGTSRSLILVR